MIGWVVVMLLNIQCSYTLHDASGQMEAPMKSDISSKPQRHILASNVTVSNRVISLPKNLHKKIEEMPNKTVIASDTRKARKPTEGHNKDKQKFGKKEIKKYYIVNNLKTKGACPENATKRILFIKAAKNRDFLARDFITTERLLFACHSTDLECFQRQYQSLRDNILLGNANMGIAPHEEYSFKYTGDTCVKLSGWEESELVMISMDGRSKRINFAYELPVRIRQVRASKTCNRPDKAFNTRVTKTENIGPMRRFTGNATVLVSYPFNLRRRSGHTYMHLEEEDIDVTFNIPDWSHLKLMDGKEAKLYEWSEWAYDMVQHVDAAQHFVMPYTNQLRVLLKKVPISRFIMLYPGEVYLRMKFSLATESYTNKLAPLDGEPLEITS